MLETHPSGGQRGRGERGCISVPRHSCRSLIGDGQTAALEAPGRGAGHRAGLTGGTASAAGWGASSPGSPAPLRPRAAQYRAPAGDRPRASGRRGRVARRCAAGRAAHQPSASPRLRGCSASPAAAERARRAAGGGSGETLGKCWEGGVGMWGSITGGCGGSLGNAGKHHQEMRGVTGGCGSAGQQVPQLRGCGRGCVRVFLCVRVCACVFVCVCCVRAACPLPRPPCQKGVGDFPASRPLKTALPGGGFVAPGGGRLAASALRRGEWAEGRAAAAAPRGRAALGCGSRRGRSLARLDGRFCRLPRAPGSFASRALSHPSFRIALQ